ncbi:regulator [Amycolatopsis sp. WAC 01375]|nr:regulator [Amycolatopsis sp. WAC 01375]RSN28670.1 regulator [Amycolatopsis sp. WAC 01416]
MTLEAFADTIIPGEKRAPDDRAIAGVSDGGGAVAAGAIELLEWDATGVSEGLGPLSAALNGHATAYAQELGLTLDESVPPFVALAFADRTALVERLTTPGHPEKDGWVLLALFSNMAYDSAAHMSTTDAIEQGHPGLLAMGFAKPESDGLWRFPKYSYGRVLAKSHPDTTESGSLS